MIAYKGFRPGMICIGYQFQMGLNVTEKANCRQNGFHCAEDPLDCLSYYGDVDHSEYYIVNAGGDIDEDEVDSKKNCSSTASPLWQTTPSESGTNMCGRTELKHGAAMRQSAAPTP